MRRLIRDGAIVDDDWLPADESASAEEGRICTLEQWQNLQNKHGSAVQIEPGEGVAALMPHLDEIALVAVNFPVFSDGRGFSYARELRERGYEGELRAVGDIIRDQITYLRRVGFNAFQPEDQSSLEAALQSLADFSEFYQASIDQPLPLFRRRG